MTFKPALRPRYKEVKAFLFRRYQASVGAARPGHIVWRYFPPGSCACRRCGLPEHRAPLCFRVSSLYCCRPGGDWAGERRQRRRVVVLCGPARHARDSSMAGSVPHEGPSSSWWHAEHRRPLTIAPSEPRVIEGPTDRPPPGLSPAAGQMHCHCIGSF